MRNILIIVGLLITLSVSAQTKLTKGGKFKGLDRQSDTAVASTTLDYTIELGNEVYGILKLAVESDSISGTSAYSSYLHTSLNGEDWGLPIDTIIHSGGGDDYGEFDAINATDTYILIRTVTTGATQKSLFKIWGRLNEGFVIQQ